MNALSFVLALGAIAVPVAWVASAASVGLVPLVRRLPAVPRAEVAVWMGLLPLLLAVGLAAAVTVPSALYGLGLGDDHCLVHGTHPHLCVWHGALLPAWLAWVGATGWAVSGLRLLRVVARLVRTERLGTSLASIGVVRDGVHVVPSSVAVCHTVGVVSPRVLISQAVLARLAPAEATAVVAHERAHLDRADPRWSAFLAVLGCAAPFSGRWAAVWREAVEEVADDVAAASTDGPTVARALVAVARMQLPAAGMAFAAGGLERRVRRLLDGSRTSRPGRAARGVWALVAVAACVVAVAHEPLHHEVEELWERAAE